jgi:hypothetical protein
MQKSKQKPDDPRAGKMKIDPHGSNDGFGFVNSDKTDDP